ncbi:thiamine pyrophosphate-dependent enzyme [Actinomyces wuliandei]|nr:thiamine pyrophosphate-dependent enzyme [Actinomyces wuliandei]
MIFVDVGLSTLWASRTLPRGYKVLYTRGFATMGAATLSALGVSDCLTRRLLVITGDGGFALSLGEFLHHAAGTASGAGGGRSSVQPDLTVLVLNNGGLGAVRYEQELRGLVPSAWAAPFNAPALAALLPAIEYVSVTSRADLERMDQGRATTRRVRVINAHVDPLEAPVPARRIDIRARTTLIRSWARQGRQGLFHAARTLPYIIDTWRF